MIFFLLRRTATMILTALCLSFIVFYLTNLPPNLEKVAKFQGNSRMTDEEVARWLDHNGYTRPTYVRYGEWLGVVPGWTDERDGTTTGRCIGTGESADTAPRFCGILQGNWGRSTVFREDVSHIVAIRLAQTGKLMFWVMLMMVPMALLIGVLAGMREGSKLDRALSTVSIMTTATPEYVSGVILIAVFASSAVGLKWFKGTATSAMDGANFENFFLPVLTIALYGTGYVARMTRASMAEVMTAQYVRTARLKGVSFRNIVLKHALRNALIAPFTVIMLQFPWLLNGVVIVETLFNFKGLGWALVQAAGNNDIDLLLGISVVSVIVVLVTQLISDIGYVYLNPRIRMS
ncbi:ABC transporter permease [Pseudooceanicola sediminis]|uniref:ABC transporter permease n=1 Tax=Pseudooceanicola sediminis TaxID=2211117 RepID=A0A399J5B8_9RHOB|nr:ABC transporter permease [Pseudooceanicola sediminis]KAA2316861.1 ABC transporter permease [Puniceibacterium sp. HSS470]RII40683.1 ABC transporter permease [Pseudooceanicola sediminis]|tara:strand:+ start:143228 stop:144271 length:1044 start_codon:yes stop_codon:yes gene_type:complete